MYAIRSYYELHKTQGTLFLKNIHTLQDLEQQILLEYLTEKQNVSIMASSHPSLFNFSYNFV